MHPYLTEAPEGLTSLSPTIAIAGVLHGADPSVLLHTDNNYYSVEARNGGVSTRKAVDLEGLGSATPQEVWTDDNALHNIWAPEIAGDNDEFFIYFSAGANDAHRMYVISSDTPGADYTTDEIELKLPDDKWAIDGALFRYNDELWFVWSGWEGDENVEQNLYICRMNGPREPTGPRYIISQPREAWERVVGDPWINEGPEAIVDPDGQLHIVYSADGSWSDSYCLGDLRLRKDGDPTNVWDWYKSNGCVMGSNENQMMDGWETTREVNGPGHHTFAVPAGRIDVSVDPSVDYPFMYHAVPKGTEYKWENREWFSGSFRWVDGVEYSRKNVPGAEKDVGWSLKFNDAS